METIHSYKVVCGAIEEVTTVKIDANSPTPEYSAAHEASEYFWSLTNGEVGKKFQLHIYNLQTGESTYVTVVVEMEPHFVIT